jgi:hypothetical protein
MSIAPRLDENKRGAPMLRLIAGFLVLSASTTAWSRDRDLQIAEKYFTKRRADIAAQSVPRAGALVQQPLLERLLPRGFEPGQRWSVRLSITRPPLNSPEVRQQKIATIRYTVLEWSGFEEGRLVLRIEAPDSPSAGLSVEERIFFREGRSELRRCRGASSCSPWTPHDSQTLRLGGEDSGFGWEHGPVLLAGDTLLRARFADGIARWESEDFFGRRSGWKWSAGEPWPSLMESAQGRAELLKQGDER